MMINHLIIIRRIVTVRAVMALRIITTIVIIIIIEEIGIEAAEVVEEDVRELIEIVIMKEHFNEPLLLRS